MYYQLIVCASTDGLSRLIKPANYVHQMCSDYYPSDCSLRGPPPYPIARAFARATDTNLLHRSPLTPKPRSLYVLHVISDDIFVSLPLLFSKTIFFFAIFSFLPPLLSPLLPAIIMFFISFDCLFCCVTLSDMFAQGISGFVFWIAWRFL